MSKNCKKCGREIPQNSKEDTCKNCQNKKNGIAMKILGVVGSLLSLVFSIVLFVISKGKFGGPKA
jgi:uncharacterized protein YqhQ